MPEVADENQPEVQTSLKLSFHSIVLDPRTVCKTLPEQKSWWPEIILALFFALMGYFLGFDNVCSLFGFETTIFYLTLFMIVDFVIFLLFIVIFEYFLRSIINFFRS